MRAPTMLTHSCDQKVRRLPSVDADNGLVGILSADDLVEIVAELLNGLVSIINREQQQEKRLRSS